MTLKDIQADVVYRGGKVYTVDDHFTIGEALAIADGKVLAVGSDAEIEQFTGPHTTVVELNGRVVLPGIDDSHLHATGYGLSGPEFAIDLSYQSVTSIAEIVEKIREAASTTPPGTWIVGLGWDQGYLAECLDGSRNMPHKQDLDEATSLHPVCLTDFSGHMIWVNSEALLIAAVTDETVAPAGGVIDRDEHGQATGILREAAQIVVQSAMPTPTLEVRTEAIRSAIRRLNERGITAFTEPGLGPGGEGLLGGALGGAAIEAYENLAEAGELHARVSALLLPIGMGESAHSLVDRVQEQRRALRPVDPKRFTVIGVKLFADGVPPNETSLMYEPYGKARKHGALCVHGESLAMQEAELRRAISQVHELGLQAGVHVTGDHAIDITVSAFVDAQLAHPRDDARHYVIHGDFISDERLADLAAHGFGVNMNPGIKSQISDLMDEIVGEELSARHWPARSASELGATLCASSDAPIVQPDWLAGITGMMTRVSKATGKVSGPDQCVDFATALRAYTINAARQSFAEDWRGSLEPGKVADLVVLDTDPMSVEPADFADIKVDLTVIDGTPVFERQ